METENTRAVVGDNRAPDAAQRVTEDMRRDYAALEESIAAALDEARALPAEVDDDETMGVFARLIKKLRDTAARAEAFRVAEKEPPMRSAQAVDGFFFALIDKVARRARTNRPGAADILQARLDAYNQRKLLAEQERRRREAAEAARVEQEARERAADEARKAEEARLAAERARKPETVASKGAAAVQAEAQASSSAIEAQVAAGAAQDAHIATLARPADLVRTRVDQGPLVTMGTEAYAEVVNFDALDRDALWPYISEAEKSKALRAWARNTGHNKPMAGASIGKRPKSVVR